VFPNVLTSVTLTVSLPCSLRINRIGQEEVCVAQCVLLCRLKVLPLLLRAPDYRACVGAGGEMWGGGLHPSWSSTALHAMSCLHTLVATVPNVAALVIRLRRRLVSLGSTAA